MPSAHFVSLYCDLNPVKNLIMTKESVILKNLIIESNTVCLN